MVEIGCLPVGLDHVAELDGELVPLITSPVKDGPKL